MDDREQIRIQINQLAALIAQLSVRQMRELMDDTGLSNSQIITLMRLRHQGDCGVSQLADHLGTSDAASSQMVQRLVTLGLVERTESLSDRREKRVTLSGAGLSLMERVTAMHRTMIEEMIRNLPPEKEATMLEAIGLLVKAAHDYEVRHDTDRAAVAV